VSHTRTCRVDGTRCRERVCDRAGLGVSSMGRGAVGSTMRPKNIFFSIFFSIICIPYCKRPPYVDVLFDPLFSFRHNTPRGYNSTFLTLFSTLGQQLVCILRQNVASSIHIQYPRRRHVTRWACGPIKKERKEEGKRQSSDKSIHKRPSRKEKLHATFMHAKSKQ